MFVFRHLCRYQPWCNTKFDNRNSQNTPLWTLVDSNPYVGTPEFGRPLSVCCVMSVKHPITMQECVSGKQRDREREAFDNCPRRVYPLVSKECVWHRHPCTLLQSQMHVPSRLSTVMHRHQTRPMLWHCFSHRSSHDEHMTELERSPCLLSKRNTDF